MISHRMDAMTATGHLGQTDFAAIQRQVTSLRVPFSMTGSLGLPVMALANEWEPISVLRQSSGGQAAIDFSLSLFRRLDVVVSRMAILSYAAGTASTLLRLLSFIFLRVIP